MSQGKCFLLKHPTYVRRTLKKFWTVLRRNKSSSTNVFSYSKNGIRLYNLARKGIEVTRDARKVIINKLKLLNFDENLQTGAFLVNCSKGTYVRTLCDDIGKKLGCGAVLTDLQRTKTVNSVSQTVLL